MRRLKMRCTQVNVALAAGLAGSATAVGQINNGGFETGNLSGWSVTSALPPPVVVSGGAHSGTYSAQLGTLSGSEPLGDAAMYQTFTVTGTGQALTFWYKTSTTDSISYDWQDAYIQNSAGTSTLQTIFHVCQSAGWLQGIVFLDPYVGQTIRIAFLVHQDGFGDDTAMNIDDVTVGPAPTARACCPPN